jgi:hypothetical protein
LKRWAGGPVGAELTEEASAARKRLLGTAKRSGNTKPRLDLPSDGFTSIKLRDAAQCGLMR